MCDGPSTKSEWTSLDIAKLLVPIIASVILAFVGLRISEQVEKFKSAVERNDKLVDSLVQKRLNLYDEIGRKLNEIFTYYMYVGKWKELSPEDIINDKRDLDEIIFTYEPFFSKEFVEAYIDLEKQLFSPFRGWGKDAQLRTEVTHRPEFYLPKDKVKLWNSAWDACFTGEDNTAAIRKSYSEFISALPGELGIPELSNRGARSIQPDQVAKPNLPPTSMK